MEKYSLLYLKRYGKWQPQESGAGIMPNYLAAVNEYALKPTVWMKDVYHTYVNMM